MIIVCPDCSKRYVLADGAIGPEGRTVKCANCEHQWFQAGEGGTVKDKDPHPPRTYQDEEPDLDFDGIDDAPKNEDPLPDFHKMLEQIDEQESQQEESVEEAGPDIPDAVKPLPEDEQEEQPSNIPAPVNAWQPLAGGYGAALALLIFIVGGFVATKETVVKSWPASAMLYNIIGMDTKVPGEGLIFDRLVAKAEKDTNGQNVVKLSGAVINLTSDQVKLPPVLASLLTTDGEKQDQWLIDLGEDDISAEEAIPFEIVYPLSSDTFESVNVTFLAGEYKTQEKQAETAEN